MNENVRLTYERTPYSKESFTGQSTLRTEDNPNYFGGCPLKFKQSQKEIIACLFFFFKHIFSLMKKIVPSDSVFSYKFVFV